MDQAAAPSAPALSMLGGLQLSCCGTAVDLCRPAQRVLAYLALLRARPIHRRVLAERLWEQADDQRALSSLRSALWRLPKLHGKPLLSSAAKTLRLAAHVRVDLWHREGQARALVGDASSIAESSAAALRDGLEQDLLPDWYDDWLVVEQESYRQLRLHALEALSAGLRESGQYTAALMAALAAVRGEPLRETAHQRVVEIHLAEGNPAEALRQYHIYRRLIADQLGLAPSPAIRQIVRPLPGRPIERQGRCVDGAVTRS